MVTSPLPYRVGGRKAYGGTNNGGGGGMLSGWSCFGMGLVLFGLSLHLYTQYYWLQPPDVGGGALSLGPSGLMAANDDRTDEPLFVVGTHHKTGTALMALVLREAQVVHKSITGGKSTGIMMGYFGNPLVADAPYSFYYCDALYTNAWNKSHNSTDHLPKLVDHHHFFQGKVKFVHLVRDPVELVVSAYLYHQSGPPHYQEPWLYDLHPTAKYETVMKGSACDTSKYTEMSWYDVLQCLNEKEGVLAEALFQTYFGALPSMIASTKHIHNKSGAKVLQIGLEEFSDDFDNTIYKLFSFFNLGGQELDKIVRSCSQYDLKRQSWSERQSNKHVTVGKQDRNQLRAYVAEFGETDAQFREARELLGYPKPHATAGGGHQQQHLSSVSGGSSNGLRPK